MPKHSLLERNPLILIVDNTSIRSSKVADIGFIGLGNMGQHMARNLIKAGHKLKVFDLNEEALRYVAQSGAKACTTAKEAASGVEFVVTMLPVGANVRSVLVNDGVIGGAAPGTIMLDCSTIDVDSADGAFRGAEQEVHACADEAADRRIEQALAAEAREGIRLQYLRPLVRIISGRVAYRISEDVREALHDRRRRRLSRHQAVRHLGPQLRLDVRQGRKFARPHVQRQVQLRKR